MLEFFENLRWGPVELLCQDPLFVKLKMAKHLAEVTIDHVFDRCVYTAEHDMVAATERLRFYPQVHL